MPHPASIRPSIALAAFAEKFVDGRRVVVFGNALSSFWEQLIERGARLVHVCDSDTARVSEAAARNTSQHVSFAPLGGSGLAVRDGAFDVGFIENLSLYADTAVTLHRLRRALGARGIAFVAAPNPDVEEAMIAGSTDSGRSLDYYTLYDSVHREFPVVRMAGQMPFVGYSVAELAPAEDPVPSIDAGFVPGGTEEPEWFVAVATLADVQFESFVVVQLPYDRLTKSGSERLLREQLRAARSAERSAVERLSRIEAEQRRFAEAAQRHQKDVDLARQIRLLQEELERKESWILQLEARATTADARADEADQELDEIRQRFNLVSDDGAPLPAATEDWRKTIERLESEKCELYARLSAAEAQPQQVEQRFAAQHASLSEALRLAQEKARTLEESVALERAEFSSRLQSTESVEQAQEKLRTLEERTSRERAEFAERTSREHAEFAERTSREHAELEQLMARERAEFGQRMARERAGLEQQVSRERAELEQQVSRERAELEQQVSRERAELDARWLDAQQKLQEASQRQSELDQSLETQERVHSAELAQLEEQLRERGERVRQLESELQVTEELGKALVRELERARSRALSFRAIEPVAGGDSAVMPPNLTAQAVPETLATENWSATARAAATPASTRLSTEHASAWTGASAAPTSEDPALRDRLDQLAGLLANQTADLVAYEWRLQQLKAERDSLALRCGNSDQLSEQLERAKAQLQQNEVLMAELAARDTMAR